MPKIKMARKSTMIDMTAMCDVAFLLLTFFMLATKFKPEEPVTVVTPSSINTKLLPDSDVILFTVDKTGRIFFSMDGQPKRKKLIEDLNSQFKLNLDQKAMNNFIVGAVVGAELKNLNSYLGMKAEARKTSGLESGIPADSANNELSTWINYARTAQGGNPRLQYCIKADNETPYPKIKEIMQTFKDLKIQKLNLVTNLEAIPPGTAAALAQQTGGKKD
ncbi:biopolymer transporter ExbD [Chitinophaga agrisoli]|uniref:Biopolymer transporter ExbD n=1 Tax=Chitinophaga agrisoli TaxID=2607653 RepID=A0A5B2VRI4_9BACT|nr:biopolymer transporter ExbD [Chitinophaga agrisoli]KAA2241288.1 biopolymer transporter ExbD [Chitinophaga agrisoli]